MSNKMITVDTGNLGTAMSHIRASVGKGQALPILGHVLMETIDGVLRLTGTNLEAQLSVDLPFAGSADFKTTADAVKLHDIVRLLPEGEATLTINEGELLVRFGRSRYKLKSLPVSDFPVVKVPNSARRFRLPERELLGMLREVDGSMAVQDVRYYLNGALVTANSDCVQVVATDGHRLALSRSSAPGASGDDVSVIVPRGLVGLMEKMLSVSEANIEIGVTEHHFVVNKAGSILVGKLIDGRFPDFKKVVPASQPHKAVVDRVAFQEMLRRAQVVADEKTKGVMLQFVANELRIESKTSDGEECIDSMPIDYAGDEVSIGVNGLYVSESLSSMGGEQVTVGFRDGMNAITLNGGNENSLAVIMPMRV